MNIPTRILAPALSILLAVMPLAGATAHALPQNDDESAYLATIDALFTQTFTILSDCKAYAVSQDQQAQCVVDGYIELKSTWDGVPVPTRSKYIDGAFGRYLKNSISNFHILNTLVAETAGGDGTYDPKTVLADLDRQQRYSAASSAGMKEFFSAFANEAGYTPGHST